MRFDRLMLLAAFLGAAGLSGCSDARPSSGSAPATECTRCHGDTSRAGSEQLRAAPPRGLNGSTDPNRVGAHTAHLGADVLCEDCHKVPGTVSAPGHRTNADGTPDSDGRAEVSFSERVTNKGALASAYDRTQHTCSNVYCHQTRSGGAGPAAPGWGGTLSGGECGSCHGLPPTGHPTRYTRNDCVRCHRTSVTADGNIRSGGTHANGVVDKPDGCADCHGDATRSASTVLQAAPPVDASGSESSTRVGAHQPHLSDGVLSKAIACTECHVVPTDFLHSTGGGARGRVSFANEAGNIAKNDGADPTWDPAAGKCGNVYCHGGTLAGGSNTQPVFSGGPSQVGIGGATPVARCGVCHGFPPSLPHPQEDSSNAPFTLVTQCNGCHPQTVDTTGAIQIATHINGVVDGGGHPDGFRQPTAHGPEALDGVARCRACHGTDLATDMGGGLSCNNCHANPSAFGLTGFPGSADWQHDCTFCHGASNRAEDPSFPLVGGVSVAVRLNQVGPPIVTGKHLTGAGAHLAHFDLNAARRFSNALICTNCHSPLPDDVNHVTGTVVVNWGTLATGGGTVSVLPTAFTPAWESSPTCTNYCHGASLPGGSNKQPTWQAPLGSIVCGNCHATPPPYDATGAFHVQNTDCNKCHAGYALTGLTLAAKATHVDGTIQKPVLGCTGCHALGAPFSASNGATLSSDPRVGAHNKHLQTTITAAMGCADTCHVNPTAPHPSGAVDITWVARASAGGATPTPAAGTIQTGQNVTCSNYCHGQRLAGGTTRTPTWTGGALGCTGCHGAPPPTGQHDIHVNGEGFGCQECHFSVMATGSNTTISTRANHINGQKNVQLLNGGTYSAPSSPDRCASACHGADQGTWTP